MSTNNYLKFMTEEIVRYLNSSKEERKVRKEAGKQSDSAILNRWFGVLPFSFKLFIRGK
ncbi:YqzE family protein [Oceanobacillus luteolus]|uniref:YqzE family protein n=1 Tax=Oceanobacillus luteolus TaxID=1274358 RepID=A0ABW4HYV9_9BACI|nr:YqzE family protein [Oceanobacillus luteolus]MCM3738747.1 YqzE family protein [Oceanobacillus luteolus]